MKKRLVKRLLKPGVYTGQDGKTHSIDAAEVQRIYDDTMRLKALGWGFFGWPDHERYSTDEILGEWLNYWLDDAGELYGLFEAWTPEAYERALKTDASIFVPGGFRLGSETFEDAITRVDIVSNGAVYDAGPFLPADEFFSSQPEKLAKLAAASPQPQITGRRLSLSALTTPESPTEAELMKSKVMRAFARAFNYEMPEDPETFDADDFDEQVMKAMQVEGEVDEEALVEMLSAKLFALPSEGEAVEETPPSIEAPQDASKSMQTPPSEVKEVEEELLEGMIDEAIGGMSCPVDPEDVQSVRAMFAAQRPAAGFRKAFAAARRQADLVGRAARAEAGGSNAAASGQKARAFSRIPRPDPKAEAGDPQRGAANASGEGEAPAKPAKKLSATAAAMKRLAEEKGGSFRI